MEALLMKYLCNKIGFPKEASDLVYAIYNGISTDEELYSKLKLATKAFLSKGYDSDYLTHLKTISENTGIHIYSVNLVFILNCAKHAKQKYNAKGIPEEIYFDTMADILYKLNECKKMYDVWGIATFTWYHGIMTLRTFKLGRLEFEIKPCPVDEYKEYVKRNETLYSCHIPSAGPLSYESVIDSFKRAYKFFNINNNLVIYCSSWLLYPKHYEVFPEGSNLRMFYDLYDIISEENDESNSNLWRVFYKDAKTPIEDLPGETSLQRNFIKYLSKGNTIGVGTGIIVFDGKKIIN